MSSSGFRGTLAAATLICIAVSCSGDIDDGSGSGGGGAPDAALGGGGGGGGGSDIYAQARIDCVDRINAFRAIEGKPPYARWSEQEACADAQAKADGDSNSAHENFGMCSERAQNTCPGWPSVDNVIQGCLQAMWDEGPGEPFSAHGHYINMSSTQYSKVACGFYQLPGGGFWASQDFQ